MRDVEGAGQRVCEGETDDKGGKKKRRILEVDMPSADFFTDFHADDHHEPFGRDSPAVHVCGVEDDCGWFSQPWSPFWMK